MACLQLLNANSLLYRLVLGVVLLLVLAASSEAGTSSELTCTSQFEFRSHFCSH
jgi:hypothetical protein